MHIERTAPPPIGIAHLTAINVAPLAFVEMAAAVGYAHVGLRLHPAFAGSPFYKIPVGTSLMRSIRSRLAETGLRVYDVELITIDADLDLETLKPVLETAAELGAQRLSVCGDDPDRGRMVATFARLCELAADHGMGVDLEMMPWRRVDTLEAAQHVVEAAQQANGAILIDALHLSRSGGAPADLGLIEPSCIRSAHLCDAAANRPATMEALIQEARGGASHSWQWRSAPPSSAGRIARLHDADCRGAEHRACARSPRMAGVSGGQTGAGGLCRARVVACGLSVKQVALPANPQHK